MNLSDGSLSDSAFRGEDPRKSVVFSYFYPRKSVVFFLFYPRKSVVFSCFYPRKSVSLQRKYLNIRFL